MKLNKKIVGALAIATLIAAVGIAGTFAKYESKVESPSDTARLATYAFDKEGTIDLFAASYDNGIGNETVKSKDMAKVIAPGTTNVTNIVFKSDSEVKTETAVYLTDVLTSGVDAPLLEHVTVEVSINGAPAADKTLQEIKGAIGNGEKIKVGNPTITLAGTADTISVPITWTYSFSSSPAQDTLDTAAASGNNLPTVQLKFTGVNTQID